MRYKSNSKYLRYKLRIKGSKNDKITVSKLFAMYNDKLNKLNDNELSQLQYDIDLYGVSLPTKDILNSDIATKDKRYILERAIGMISGEYQDIRKTIFISNYIYGLKSAGVSNYYVSTLYSVLYDMSSTDIGLLIKSNLLPNTFIYYENDNPIGRIEDLEEDLDIVIDKLSPVANKNIEDL